MEKKILESWFQINFKEGTPIPNAKQDIFAGVIDNFVVISCGSSACSLRSGRGGGRSFDNSTYSLDLDQLLEQYQKLKLGEIKKINLPWKKIANFPGHPRQKGTCITLDNMLLCWGGFSYQPARRLNKKVMASKKRETNSYADGFVLLRRNGKWIWKNLPDLPYLMCSSSFTQIGNYIYMFGGCDFHDSSFNTWQDRFGENERFGARLYRISVSLLKEFILNDGPAPEWERLPDCQNEEDGLGTPRMNHVAIAVKDKIYVLGGASGRPFGGSFFSIVDNWCYDPTTEKWTRLADHPSSNTNCQKAVVYKDRYILLVGGAHTINSKKKCVTRQVINWNQEIRSGYGNFRSHKKDDHQGIMSADIIAYDTETNTFGNFYGETEEILPLPWDLNNPFVIKIKENLVLLIAGEIEIGRKDRVPTSLKTYLSDTFLIGEIVDKTRNLDLV